MDTASEAGSYADALRFPPWIEDRDGASFANISFITPDLALERLLNAGERSGDAAPLSPDLSSHEDANTQEGPHDHA